MIIKKSGERKVYLKGMVWGKFSGISEGYLTESVSGSGVYDQYQAMWRLTQVGSQTISATINLNGTVTYQTSTEHSSTQLYVLQTSIDGNSFGHYTGPLSTVLTHLRVADESNPYYGEGFSLISYISDSGSGEGWAYNNLVSANISELKGMFTSPLLGIVSATLDETGSPRNFIVNIDRIDLGLPPMADLEVRVWGPERVSPGQTVTYTIEYRNDGIKSAENLVLIYDLPEVAEYISSTENGIYVDSYREIVWGLNTLPPKTKGYVNAKIRFPWGLSQGELQDNFVRIGTTSEELDVNQTGITPFNIDRYLNLHQIVSTEY